MTDHIDHTVASWSQTLRVHGLSGPILYAVCQATTIDKLLYASPAWYGYTHASDRSRLESIIQKCKRLGYLEATHATASDIALKSDNNIFNAVSSNPSHVLHSLLPPAKVNDHNLRARMHNYTVPPKDSKNFIVRMLY